MIEDVGEEHVRCRLDETESLPLVSMIFAPAIAKAGEKYRVLIGSDTEPGLIIAWFAR
jgi:hypothetical protein